MMNDAATGMGPGVTKLLADTDRWRLMSEEQLERRLPLLRQHIQVIEILRQELPHFSPHFQLAGQLKIIFENKAKALNIDFRQTRTILHHLFPGRDATFYTAYRVLTALRNDLIQCHQHVAGVFHRDGSVAKGEYDGIVPAFRLMAADPASVEPAE